MARTEHKSILIMITALCVALCGCGQGAGFETLRGQVPAAGDASREHSAASSDQAPSISFINVTQGNGSSGSGTGRITSVSVSSLPSADYTTPMLIPHTLVDQAGYTTDSEKGVIFTGLEASEPFEIRDSASNEVVYSGVMRRRIADEATGTVTCYGSFDEVTEPGTYYVFTDTLGESYDFRVSEDIYTELMRYACKQFYLNRCGLTLVEALAGEDAHSACHTLPATLQSDNRTTLDVSGGWHLDALAGRDVAQGCDIMTELLQSYELNPDGFDDETGIPESGDGIPDVLNETAYEAQWLLKMQDTRSGGVYGSAIASGVDEHSSDQTLLSARIEVTPITLAATIAFAAAMARFSYNYRAYDQALATECLRASDRAYRFYLANAADTEGGSEKVLAAAALLRATGSSSYESVVTEAVKAEGFGESFFTDRALFHAGVIYLTSTRITDTAACQTMMELILRKAEEQAKQSQSSPWLVVPCDDPTGLPSSIEPLVVANHIIPNAEYAGIIENHLHYLSGRNPDAINYITDATGRGAGLSMMTDPLHIAQLTLLLGNGPARSLRP